MSGASDDDDNCDEDENDGSEDDSNEDDGGGEVDTESFGKVSSEIAKHLGVDDQK